MAIALCTTADTATARWGAAAGGDARGVAAASGQQDTRGRRQTCCGPVSNAGSMVRGIGGSVALLFLFGQCTATLRSTLWLRTADLAGASLY